VARLIAVAGMMGSGKTTLARNLASLLGWSYLPKSRHATKFLPDLFVNQGRWAFDTQISFLIEKSLQVIQSAEANEDIVLDRSLQEDISVFASHFYESGAIDKRSFETYRTLAQYFLERAPRPTLVLYCQCPLRITLERIQDRSAGIKFNYPAAHLPSIDRRYKDWRAQYEDSEILDIDTEANDFRDMGAVQRLIDGPIAQQYDAQLGAQLQFFTSALSRRSDFALKRRVARAPVKPTSKTRNRYDVQPYDDLLISRPIVYIAAPFTAAAGAKTAVSPRRQLFEDRTSYGIIPRGPYRRGLAALAKSFAKLGLDGFLPHRDVNKWGRKRISAPTVFAECSYHVSRSALFVGILGQSHGSHYEFGIAQGLGIPSICITCDELSESFIASGVQTSQRTLHWRCARIKELPHLLANKEVREFIYSSIGK
jgi:deoxyadenosine/deoxycytidine kinase